MLKRGSDRLHDRMRGTAAQTVVYSDGPTALSIPAVIASTLVDVVSQDGTAIKVELRDFIVTVADLGSLYPPKRGQTVEYQGRIHDVLPRGDTESVWRHSDRHGKAVRVFTKARTP